MQRDGIEMNRARENDLESSEMLDGVRQGDSGAIAQFVMYYHKSIQTVVHDVIADPDIAREVTGDTLKTVVKQLQLGVHTGDFEPWLMWMARNNAMMYVRLDRTTPPPEPAPAPRYAPPPEPVRYAATPPEPAPAPCYAVSPEPVRYAATPPEPAPAPRYTTPPEPVRYVAPPPEPVPAPRYAAPPEPAPAPSPLLDDTQAASSFEAEERQTDVLQPPKDPPTQNRGLHVVPQKQNFRYLDMLIIILMVLIIIFLLWVLTGLLAKLNIFTIPDLGYNWFNSHLFRLF